MAIIDNLTINEQKGRKTRFSLDENTAGCAWITRNGCFPIVIAHKNTATYPIATIAVSSSAITFSHGATYATVAVDAGIGTAGVYDAVAATYQTLVEVINASTYWRAYLLDGRGSQTCIFKDLSKANTNASLASQASGVGLLQNLSTTTDVHRCGFRNVDLRGTFPFSAVENGTLDTGHYCKLYGLQTSINATGSPVLKIYDCDEANETEDIIYQPAVLTDDTATAYNFEDLMGGALFVNAGHRIVVDIAQNAIVTESYIAMQGSVYKP